MTALAALNRAYDAWCRTQPQLILDLWGDALDEPALYPVSPSGAGSSSTLPLTAGADPCSGTPSGLTALSHAGTDTRAVSSAPLSYDGPGRCLPQDPSAGATGGRV